MTFLTRSFVPLLLVCLSAQTLRAQQRLELPSTTPQTQAAADEPRDIHITDRLMQAPEGKAALRSYLEARDAGLTLLRKGVSTDTVGTLEEFNVRVNVLAPSPSWEPDTFKLRATSAVANVWVADSLSDSFDDAALEELESYILDTTPEGSFRPDSGIIANDNEIFGDPPLAVDSDGKVDILLFDIEEGSSLGCCVLGFFDPVDQRPYPFPGEGNPGNFLYVDLPDGMSNGGVFGIGGTIAHEYQHLIHFAYMSSGLDELTFVNEGMSEWAEVVNGLITRQITYLTIPGEHERPLLDWRTNEQTTIVERDYQRAGLFTTYVADRIGRVATGSILQAKGSDGNYAVGAAGYDLVLTDHELSLAQVAADFHAANLVNDVAALDPYGYSLEKRQTFPIAPTVSVDGRVDASPSLDSLGLTSGAVNYLSWSDVSNLDLEIADAPESDAQNRSRASLRLFLEEIDGTERIVDLDAGTQTYLVEGDFERVTLIVTHVEFGTTSTTPPLLLLDVSATWEGAASFAEESVAYDDGQNTGNFFFFAEQNVQANGFDVPGNALLSSVSVAPVYENQFSNGPGPGLPRDFTLTIWGDDGTGLPGEELYSKVIEESTGASHVVLGSSIPTYSLLEVDLSSAGSALESLPNRIYVGVTNAGDDENLLVLAPAGNTSGEEVSYVYDAGGGSWVTISNFRDEVIGKTFPIRAKFLIPTATETTAELPAAVTLDQNYPNPFNPATTIRYTLPQPMRVRLTVYNILGQRVATVVDALQSAGTHETRLDASGWASGVYVYALETEAQTLTQRMVVLK